MQQTTTRMKSTLMRTMAPSGTAMRTGSGTLASLLSFTIGIGVRLVELGIVGSLGEMTSVGADSRDVVTLDMLVKV